MLYFINQFKLQPGNVLIMSLLLLATGIAGALAVAVLVISEVRQSSAMDSGLVAYFSAESGLEKIIYDVRQRNICSEPNNCDYNNQYQDCLLPQVYPTTNECAGNNIGCTQIKCQQQIGPATILEVPILDTNDTFQLDLDPADGVEGFIFNWNQPFGADPLSLPLLEVSYVMVDNSGLSQIFRPNSGVPYNCNANEEGVCQSVNNESGNYPFAGTVYQLRLKALRGKIVNLKISPKPPGVTLLNYLDVKSRGEKSSIQQILRTIVPRNLPVYGFPDYVIFSEQTIVK